MDKEKLNQEILKGMDEMTNIQSMVANVNMEMEKANMVMFTSLGNVNCNGKDYSAVIKEQAKMFDKKLTLDENGNIQVNPGSLRHCTDMDEFFLNADGVLEPKPVKEEPKRPLVVNLFAGPGAGKSTGAAFLFAYLKLLKVNVELVTEFAKELAWEGDKEFMANNQVYITGQQIRRMNRLIGKVDVIITDSPIELGALYTDSSLLKDLCYSEGRKWERRLDFFVNRVKPYNPSGRNQTLEEAQNLDTKILMTVPNMLTIPGDMDGYFNALETILRRLGYDVPYIDGMSHTDNMINFFKTKG
jgi:hypothetical protein